MTEPRRRTHTAGSELRRMVHAEMILGRRFSCEQWTTNGVFVRLGTCQTVALSAVPSRQRMGGQPPQHDETKTLGTFLHRST